MATYTYGSKIQDHYLHPRNVGSLDAADKHVGTAMVGTPELGAVLKLQLHIENARIACARFKAFGCGATIAAGSWATEWLEGKALEEAENLQGQDLVQGLELPALKTHCALLVEDGVRAALNDYKAKQHS